MTAQLWYLAGIIILSVALFFPVRNLIWVLSVRRLERKTQSKLDERERSAQRQRAAFLAALLAIAFSAAFNYVMFGPPV